MIKKIVCIAIPLFCVIALFLKLSGVDHVEFNNDYYNFMASILQRSQKFTFAIPNIPEIPTINNGFVDALIGFVNGLSSVINIISTVLNVCIKVLAFILGLLEAAIDGLKGFIPAPLVVMSV